MERGSRLPMGRERADSTIGAVPEAGARVRGRLREHSCRELIQARAVRQHQSPVHSRSAPHYLRFARAIALVAVAGAASATSGCCPLVPTSVVCNHCECPYGPSGASRPVMCDTIGRLDQCCVPPVPGPLAPPSLSS
jgi:hypothetical protein